MLLVDRCLEGMVDADPVVPLVEMVDMDLDLVGTLLPEEDDGDFAGGGLGDLEEDDFGDLEDEGGRGFDEEEEGVEGALGGLGAESLLPLLPRLLRLEVLPRLVVLTRLMVDFGFMGE